MGKKHSNTAKAKAFIICIFAFEFMGIPAEICQKIDDCSCKKSNGKVINLKAIDGGSKGAAFKDIPTVDDPRYTFDWNPCTKFSEGSECNNMLMCQINVKSTTPEINPCAQTATDFRVHDDGSTTIVYQPYTDAKDYKRTVEILLKCDKTQYPGNTGDGVSEFYQEKNSAYSMTFTSKCACDDGCLSTAESGLSIGSILLIVFFVLVFVYLVGGILFKKYKVGVESMPEMVPNYEFWAGIPSLVKDGIVFTCGGLKSGCITLYQKCSNDVYGKV